MFNVVISCLHACCRSFWIPPVCLHFDLPDGTSIKVRCFAPGKMMEVSKFWVTIYRYVDFPITSLCLLSSLFQYEFANKFFCFPRSQRAKLTVTRVQLMQRADVSTPISENEYQWNLNLTKFKEVALIRLIYRWHGLRFWIVVGALTLMKGQ